MIERVERYRFDGKEFDSLKAVAKYVENELGKIIDSTPNRLTCKDALAIGEALVNNRRRLCQLLSAEYYVEPGGIQSEQRSIFDL